MRERLLRESAKRRRTAAGGLGFEGLGFRSSGFRVQGLGLPGLGVSSRAHPVSDLLYRRFSGLFGLGSFAPHDRRRRKGFVVDGPASLNEDFNMLGVNISLGF